MKYDVFISYSSHDQKIVEGICGYLEARGIRCFVAYRDIPRGVVWASAIVDALDESSMMLVAFSESFNQSKQVDREIELASEDDKPILTFRLSESKFSGAKRYYLKNLNWIDAFPNPDNAFGDLYKNICRLLGKEEKQFSFTSNSVSQFTSSYRDGNTSQISSQNTPIQNSTQASSSVSQPRVNPIKPDIKQMGGNNFIDGHEYVDLGLPSGLKWATCNVGASKPEEYGDYFAWGETRTKSTYIEGNSDTYSKNTVWLGSNGYIAGSRGNYYLTLCHDAAHQNWGRSWRMPTRKDMDELIRNTTSEWTTRNGVEGRLVKSKNNGNSIFFPAAGWRYATSLRFAGKYGYYWVSTPYEEDQRDSKSAYDLGFDIGNFYLSWGFRSSGFSVRPVSDD